MSDSSLIYIILIILTEYSLKISNRNPKNKIIAQKEENCFHGCVII